jgi:hypothetical protein
MGDLRPNNGGGTPPEDGGGAYPGDLPDFPPEWGTIVIPDNAAELEAEASALRRELRRETRRSRLRSTFGLAPAGQDAPSLGVPVVIMAVAVITTLLSLFVVTWDHRRSATAPVGPGAVSATAVPLVNVTLSDAAGARVQLGGVLPAVLLLVHGCDCPELVAAIAAAAPAPITVIPVDRTAPCAVGTAPNVRCLADPDGALTSRYTAAEPPSPSSPGGSGSASTSPSSAAPTMTAVMVDASGNATAPTTVDSVDDLTASIAKLAAG